MWNIIIIHNTYQEIYCLIWAAQLTKLDDPKDSSSCVWGSTVFYATSRRFCSQRAVSGSKLFRSGFGWPGGRRVGHSLMMWEAVCSGAPHVQAGEVLNPQRCMLAWNLPTPVRSLLRVTQSFRGRSAPGGSLVFGVTVNWGGLGVCCQLSFHAVRVLWVPSRRVSACRLNGLRERRRWRSGWVFWMVWCKGWVRSWSALFTSCWV